MNDCTVARRPAGLPKGHAGFNGVAALLALLCLAALWRWLTARYLNIELYADEAQYWTWSLAPDWGYFSKPPMVAWLIHADTRLFGDTETGVRAATYLIWPMTAGALALLMRELFRDEPWGARAALWAAALFLSLPMTSLGGMLITTDAPLLLFWSLSLWLLARALRRGGAANWLLAGACAGLGLMSKYSMVFFLPALAAYLAFTPAHRPLLRAWPPYAAVALAALLLLPNVAWNFGNDFVSYRHTAEITQLDQAWLHPDALLTFLAAQFAVFGPLAFAGLIGVTLRARAWLGDARMRLLAAFCLLPLLAFLALSLLSRAFANWAAFAYVAGCGLLAGWWVSRGKTHWLALALGINLAMGLALYHHHDILRALDIPLSRKNDPYKRVTGYRALGLEVAERLRAEPDLKLLGDDRKDMALLLYYARPQSLDAAFLSPGPGIDNHYALTRKLPPGDAGAYLLVSELAADPAALRRLFHTVQARAPIHIAVYPDYTLRYHVWRVAGYRGE